LDPLKRVSEFACILHIFTSPNFVMWNTVYGTEAYKDISGMVVMGTAVASRESVPQRNFYNKWLKLFQDQPDRYALFL
jgi:hypothetical protein